MAPPDLRTERLLLRQWMPADAEAALAIYGDPEVTRWLGGMQPVADVAAVRALFERMAERVSRYAPGMGGWALIRQDTGQPVGGALLKPLPDVDDQPTDHIEIGWHLARHAWGRGYATEAGRRILQYGFDELGLDAIHAVVMFGNAPSIAVARRLGLDPMGTTAKFYGQELDLFTRTRG